MFDVANSMCCQLQSMMWELVFLSADEWKHSYQSIHDDAKAARSQKLIWISTYDLSCYINLSFNCILDKKSKLA